MIRVGVLGAGGKMGSTVCHAVLGTADLELVAAIDPGVSGRRLRELSGLDSDLVITSAVEGLLEAGAEVAIDFTVAKSATANMAYCADHGVHVVCGTTGISRAELDQLASLFSPAERPNGVIAPNFAITAVLMMRFSELAARYLDGVEIIELHHDEKRDAPSGTALETARRIAASRKSADAGGFASDPTTDMVLPGARGGVHSDGVHIHSVRLPGLIAHQEVLFGSPGQALSIRQDSFDRSSFMPGVLLAARKVPTTLGFTVGLDALLDL